MEFMAWIPNKNFLTSDDIFGVIEVKLAERDEIRRNQSSW